MVDSLNEAMAIVESMSAISLDEIKTLALLDRLDVKFILNTQQLAQILARLRNQYRVLEINGVRPGRYLTTYYDTPDFQMFQAHHNGLRVRHKVRWRWYIDSSLVFLEVKEKTNRERTVKTRTILPAPPNSLSEVSSIWMPTSLTVEPCTLMPVVWNRFQRITLADFERQERITIDINLEFGRDDQVIAFPDLVIVEVKQRKFSLASPIGRELHRLQLHPTHISKYCVSMAMLHPELKHNRFKPILRRLSAITEG
jgi:hypothetical protein